jgi:hypothetical protein
MHAAYPDTVVATFRWNCLLFAHICGAQHFNGSNEVACVMCDGGLLLIRFELERVALGKINTAIVTQLQIYMWNKLAPNYCIVCARR